MDGYKEFQGKSLDDAIREAIIYFDASREKLEIDIVQDAKTGVFGLIGARKAKIRARRVELKATVEELMGRTSESRSVFVRRDSDAEFSADSETRRESNARERSSRRRRTPKLMREERANSVSSSVETTQDIQPEKKAEPRQPHESCDVREQREPREPERSTIEKEHSTLDVPTTASDDYAPEGNGEDGERAERSSRRRRRGGRGRGRSRVDSVASTELSEERGLEAETSSIPVDAPVSSAPVPAPTTTADAPEDFDTDDVVSEGFPEISLEQLDQEKVYSIAVEVAERLVIPIIGEASVTVVVAEERIKISVDCGEHSGLLIGREGQTLSSIQYLASRIIARKLGTAVRVQFDTGDYRERQDEKLRDLALNLAERVRTTGRPQSTRPLSSYHRRVVHMALQEEEDIITRSKGEGALKRVIILRRRKNPDM